MLLIDNVSKTYPNGTRALDGITLEIPTGVFGLLGPNGAGKSSLMRTLATLQAPTAGRLSIDGMDIVANPEKTRALLGYLPQDFGLYPQATAEGQLEHFAVLKGVADRHARKRLVEELLVNVNLWAVRKQRVGGFSGGMRQRLGLAQALIGNPRLLIVDEPTSGLDPAERHRVLDLLAEAGRQSIVLLSTHIVAEVEALCPQVAIIAGGRVRAVSSPQLAMAQLEGRLWHIPRGVDPGPAVPVIATRRLGGRVVDLALADVAPTSDSERVNVTLEDAYFATLHDAGLAAHG